MARTLLIRTTDGSRRTVPLEGDRYGLGRAQENDLRFPDDSSLSRRHLVLEKDGDGWVLQDLGSKNGTFVNGTRIAARHRLRPGDRITAGHLNMAFDDPLGDAGGQVTFLQGPDADLPAQGTVISSLEKALSPESFSTASGRIRAPALARPESRPLGGTAVNVLIRAGQELSIRRPLPELFQLILDLSLQAVEAERGVLLTLEKDDLLVRAHKGDAFRISAAVRDRVLQSRHSLLVRDTRLDEALRNRLSINEQNVRTLMAVPLQTNDRVIGLIYVDSPALASEPTAEDLDLLTVLANVAAIRIEQERLAMVEEAERFLAQELEQAAEIQRGLLPGAAPSLADFDLAGYNTPCRTVGGDYYDFFPFPDGRLALVLADVTGKGLSAALLMADVRAKVQVLVEEPDDLPRLMSRLDRMMEKSCPANRYVTFFFAIVDPASGAMRYSNAGHNPPLLVRSSGLIDELRGGGMPLGMLPGLGYEECSCRLEPGECVVMYSDGVTESASPGGEEFGEERLGRTLLDLRAEPASAILAGVGRALADWTGGLPPTDDVTLVVVKRR